MNLFMARDDNPYAKGTCWATLAISLEDFWAKKRDG